MITPVSNIGCRKKYNPNFQKLIITSKTDWTPEVLDHFVSNKEVQRAVKILNKFGKDLYVSKISNFIGLKIEGGIYNIFANNEKSLLESINKFNADEFLKFMFKEIFNKAYMDKVISKIDRFNESLEPGPNIKEAQSDSKKVLSEKFSILSKFLKKIKSR